MAETLYIYITDIDGGQADWLFKDNNDGTVRNLESGSLASLEEKYRNQVQAASKVVCIIDSGLIHYSHATIPGKNRQRILQAVPFALEDQLAEDIDAFHFVLGKSRDEHYTIAATPHSLVQKVLNTLSKHGIRVDQLYPDILLLPQQAASWNLLCLQSQYHLQYENDDIIHIDPDNLDTLLKLALSEKPDSQTLTIWSREEITLPTLPDNIECVQKRLNTPALTSLLAGTRFEHAINLLQGEYKPEQRQTQWWQPWKIAAIIAAVAISLQLVSGIIDLQQLKKQNGLYQFEIDRIYRTSFPESKRIVNARVQMESKLKQLKQSGTSASSSFTETLADVSSLLSQTPSLTMQAVNYRNQKIELQFTVDKLATAEDLKNRLNKITGIKAEMLSASSEAHQVNARIRLEAI